MTEITQEDVDVFMESLRRKGTPWADGCAALIGTLWNGYTPRPEAVPLTRKELDYSMRLHGRILVLRARLTNTSLPDPQEITKELHALEWAVGKLTPSAHVARTPLSEKALAADADDPGGPHPGWAFAPSPRGTLTCPATKQPCNDFCEPGKDNCAESGEPLPQSGSKE